MPQNTKKVPMRKCMGCNETKPKKELIRIVREPDGKITLDERGKVSGRGVYICPDINCFAKVKKTGRLARCLEAEIPDGIYEALEECFKKIEASSEKSEVQS